MKLFSFNINNTKPGKNREKQEHWDKGTGGGKKKSAAKIKNNYLKIYFDLVTKAYQKIPGNHQQYNAEYIQFHKFQTRT